MNFKLSFGVLIMFYVASPSMGQVGSSIGSAGVPDPKEDLNNLVGKPKMDQSTSIMARPGPPVGLSSRLNQLEAEFREKIEDIKTQTSKSIKDQNEKITKVMGWEHKLAHLLNQSMEVMRELKTQNKDQAKRIDQLEQKVTMLQNTSPTTPALTRGSNKEKIRNGASNNMGQVFKASTPPSSCQELAMLDYYLDGLYLVKNKQTKKIQTVFCKFSAHDQAYETIIGYNDIKTAPVSFLVTSTSWYSIYNNIATSIPFEKEVFNFGGAMNRQTGIFTTPKKGRYFFSFKTRSQHQSDARLTLRVNRNKVLYVGGYSAYENMPISTVLDLNVNDIVDFHLEHGSIDFNSGELFFSGILLEEDLVLP